MLRFTFIFAGIVLFTACGTASSLLTDDRRESYVRKNDLSETDSVHVMEGRIYRGMSIDHALAALGPPDGQDTTATADGQRRVEYLYKARPNAFDPGNLPRAYVYAMNQKVTDWTDLDKIPRFEAYYEGGM